MASGRFLFSAVLPHSRERQEQDEHTAANKQLRVLVYSFNGGGEESRTPVQKSIHTGISERRHFFKFPHTVVKCQTTVFGSSE